MADAPLADILARLDIVIFERLPGDLFVRVESPRSPSWFACLSLDPTHNERAAIVAAMPFLGHFLAEAEELWRKGGEERVRSDPFAMTDASGRDILLVASAIVAADRCFLIIESPPDVEERRQALQGAREQLLAHEAHLRRTRALLNPVEAARSLTQQLAASALTPEQQRLAAGIAEQLAGLSGSIDSLAPLPKGVSGRSRR